MVAGTRIAAGAENATVAVSKVISPPPFSISSI